MNVVFEEARRLLGKLEQVSLAGKEIAIEAVENFRRLRAKGLTIRGTIDVIIATLRLRDGVRLLQNDRDFDACDAHFDLQVVHCAA